RMTSLGWTSSRNSYQIWAGQDVLALEAQVATDGDNNAKLQATITQLNGQVTALKQTQTGNLTPALGAALAQMQPLAPQFAATLSAIMSAFASATAPAPQPVVTAPLPAAPAAAAN